VEEETLGKRIRRLREEQGLSLAQVADGHFSRAFLHQVELGKSQPSVGVLRRIARRLDASIDELLEGERHHLRRQLALERARLALVQGEPALALELVEPLRDTQSWTAGADARLCAAEALLLLDRRQESLALLDEEEPAARARDDRVRLARISALRAGEAHRLDAAGHKRVAEQALRSGDPEAALEHLRAARILAEASQPSLEAGKAIRLRDPALRRRRPPLPGREGLEL
jgi:transcriptional regulator with XRE-family HTH domain